MVDIGTEQNAHGEYPVAYIGNPAKTETFQGERALHALEDILIHQPLTLEAQPRLRLETPDPFNH